MPADQVLLADPDTIILVDADTVLLVRDGTPVVAQGGFIEARRRLQEQEAEWRERLRREDEEIMVVLA